METLLEFSNISKSYSGITVLKDMNMKLSEGEILCLVGENGAGKSTMIKILSGAIAPDHGEISLFGKKYTRLLPRQAIELGVATIYQEIDLVDNLTVADNIFLGEEIKNSLGVVDYKKQEEITEKLLTEINLHKIRPGELLSNLSTAQKQSIQIVKALKHDCKILILDEPTSSLGEEETNALLELVKSLSKKGIGIIYISHYLDEIFRIGTKVLVLKDGNKVSEYQVADTSEEMLIHDMIGRDASSFYQREHFPLGESKLRIEHFNRDTVVKDVSFELTSGEIFGLGGLVGAGRTELVRMIYGCDKNRTGKVLLDGKNITPHSPKDAIKKGIYMISEDRKALGLFLTRSVKENITITYNEQRQIIPLGKESRQVDNAIDSMQIKVHSQNQEVGKLSGGNQQKVIIARCLQEKGRVYIFDEPTKGVDVGAKEEIYRHMLEIAKDGNFVIMVSSSMPELISMSDRIGVMREGELVDIVNSSEATEDMLLKKFIGIE
ncbi:MAG: sugar ABC transporter ATP-binding protein [Eubacteriales bacterium]|nr:sugar ABC transporter ATP-binding protein [Eubacteriales bacterium]